MEVRRRQTVERKAKFIAQVMRGRLDVREIEDVGDVALSYAEVKALACGDPRILEKARVDTETTRLERLQRSWTRTQRSLETTVDGADRRLPVLQADLQRLDAATSRVQPTRGDAFRMTVRGTNYDSRADAAIALRHALSRIDPSTADTAAQSVAQLGGFDVLAAGRRLLQPHLRLELADVPRSGLDVGLNELRSDRPLGIITRLENRVAGLTGVRTELSHEIERASTERARAAAELGQPFPHTQALETARHRGAELEAELADEATRTDSKPAAPGPGASAGQEPATGTPVLDVRSERESWAARLHPATQGGAFAVWDMQDGRFGAIRQRDGLPQGGVVGPAHTSHEQADAFATALNAGHTIDQARQAAHRVAAPDTTAAPATPATLVDNAPPGGWTDADRVTPAPEPDTSRWPSAQRHPIGSALSVHAIGADGRGRQLGRGLVVGHPGPDHVVVESPFGTRRTAPISHVQRIDKADLAHPARLPQPAPAQPPAQSAADSWTSLAHTIDPSMTDDPGWPALAHALQRAEDAGYPARQQLATLAAEVLPDANPARALHYRLVDATEAAAAVEPTRGPDSRPDQPRPDTHSLPGTAAPRAPGPAR